MSYILSIKNKKGKFKRYKVPEDVYIYVKQLEVYINYPNLSELLKLYPDRFENAKERLTKEVSRSKDYLYYSRKMLEKCKEDRMKKPERYKFEGLPGILVDKL